MKTTSERVPARGRVARAARLRVPSHRDAHCRGSEAYWGLDSRVDGRVISFAPFLPLDRRDRALKVWCGLSHRKRGDRSRRQPRDHRAQVVTIYRLTRLAPSGPLWRVSRKMILS